MGSNTNPGKETPQQNTERVMNVNFQEGNKTVIVLEDNELIVARMMLQSVLDSGYIVGEDREKMLRITLRMQAIIFRRIIDEKERHRYKTCCLCFRQIDTEHDNFVMRGTFFNHQQCPLQKVTP